MVGRPSRRRAAVAAVSKAARRSTVVLWGILGLVVFGALYGRTVFKDARAAQEKAWVASLHPAHPPTPPTRTPSPPSTLPTPQVPDLPPPAPPVPPTVPEPVPVGEPIIKPTDRDVAIVQAYLRSVDRRPTVLDHFKVVARQFKITREDVVDATWVVGTYQHHLFDEAGKWAGRDVVGRVKVQAVDWSNLGPYTASISLTVVGCPEHPRWDGHPGRDEKLDGLVAAALKEVARNLPAEIDGYEASLWYEGPSCPIESMGYRATWDRNKGITLE